MLKNREIQRGESHLPASDAQQEADHVGLLLLLKLFHILEGTHLEKVNKRLAEEKKNFLQL